MDERKDTAVEVLLEHLIEHGPSARANQISRRQVTVPGRIVKSARIEILNA
ncbi:hypothetical protein [Amaricoccus sp. W119]|uniref:hypothetical protein n=1 Tax=Amaricoccus sp. W119 TaxID=3391833 RepID=UPI0039A745AF